jgi:hypothetical protein
METTEVKIPLFPGSYGIIDDCLMTLQSSRSSASVNYLSGFPELEEIDVMRLTSNLHYACQIQPENEFMADGSSYDAPVLADSERAGWTEMVIPGDRNDSRVFLIARTSLENAPVSEFSGTAGFDLADGISLQAIKR